jgi:hypothetical protein
LSDLECASERTDVFAEHEYARIAAHLVAKRGAYGLEVSYLSHLCFRIDHG